MITIVYNNDDTDDDNYDNDDGNGNNDENIIGKWGMEHP